MGVHSAGQEGPTELRSVEDAIKKRRHDCKRLDFTANGGTAVQVKLKLQLEALGVHEGAELHLCLVKGAVTRN